MAQTINQSDISELHADSDLNEDFCRLAMRLIEHGDRHRVQALVAVVHILPSILPHGRLVRTIAICSSFVAGILFLTSGVLFLTYHYPTNVAMVPISVGTMMWIGSVTMTQMVISPDRLVQVFNSKQLWNVK